MNNYKFRGKTAAGKWVYVYLSGIYTAGRNENGFIFTDKAIIYSQEDNRNYDVKRETVGQWTGQKDIKNNDLYEGDILKVAGCLLVVKFEPCFFNSENTFSSVGFYLQKVKSRYEETMQWDKEPYYELVGNIHDNPELLEGK